MLFRKCGCLVGLENRIFRKSISVDRKKYALTTEIHFRSYFHFKWFPEREREREREREEEEGEPRAPVQSDDRQQTPSSSSMIARIGLVDRSTAPIAPHRSISPSISPPRDLTFDLATRSLSLSLCDFDFCCCCGGVVVWWWCFGGCGF